MPRSRVLLGLLLGAAGGTVLAVLFLLTSGDAVDWQTPVLAMGVTGSVLGVLVVAALARDIRSR